MSAECHQVDEKTVKLTCFSPRNFLWYVYETMTMAAITAQTTTKMTVPERTRSMPIFKVLAELWCPSTITNPLMINTIAPMVIAWFIKGGAQLKSKDRSFSIEPNLRASVQARAVQSNKKEALTIHVQWLQAQSSRVQWQWMR